MNLIFKQISPGLNKFLIIVSLWLHIFSLFTTGNQEVVIPNNDQGGVCHLDTERSFTFQCAVFEKDIKSKSDRSIERVKSNYDLLPSQSLFDTEINFICSLKPEDEKLTGFNFHNYGLTRGPPIH